MLESITKWCQTSITNRLLLRFDQYGKTLISVQVSGFPSRLRMKFLKVGYCDSTVAENFRTRVQDVHAERSRFHHITRVNKT